MSLSSAVQWWEEWQLRILVLSSLTVQWLLFVSALWRWRPIPGWLRSLIWLAYLGSDALAIYSLATLFNRRRKQEDLANAASTALEATWVPVLLIHLGGQDGITAYNIEDNELWRRHVLTAVSQITLGIYVFCKSWPVFNMNHKTRNKKVAILPKAIIILLATKMPCTEINMSHRTMAVHDHKRKRDAASYWMFNDHRGQWTLERNKCNYLAWSLNCPFDESVLLWHVATDLCFYSGKFAGHRCDFSEVKSAWQQLLEEMASDKGMSLPSPRSSSQCGEFTSCKAVQCRQMSNYMMYLLFVNPEMLLPGSRRNLFTTAYGELKGILEDKKPAATMEDSAGTRQGNKPPVEEKDVTRSIITKLKSTQGSQQEGFLHDAWSLAQGLLDLGNEKKMWEVIEGVWVEMLCFSAGRCRGYLHAKSLGTGGELLTYIWLPLSHMGMETLAERLQRTELPSSGGNTRAAAGEGIV
nr:unnamed protein product [Digitaria exilis]